MGPLLALGLAGAAVNIAGTLGAGSAERRAADNKATALRQAAQRRLEKGKLEAETKMVEGGMYQTSYMSNLLSRGGSRQALVDDLSLEEIMNRAKFESEQALSDARFEYNAMLNDAENVSKMGRSAQKAAAYKATGSILGLGTDYLYAKYGKDAYNMSFGQLFSWD